MRKHFILPGILGFAIVAVIATFALSKQQTRGQNKQPTVVASLNFYGEMAQAVGGKYANVISVINGTKIDPHDYDPTPSVAKTYTKADVVISNGAGYDAWSSRFAKQNHSKTITVAQLDHYKAGENEHLWFKPETAGKLVRTLAATLSKQDPKHASYYHKRAQKYLKRLRPLRQLQEQTAKQLTGTHYLATEPVYDNTLQALGAKSALPDFAAAVDEENDPSTGDILQWHSLIKEHQVRFVINNPQNSSRVVKNAIAYARTHKVPVINVTETKPAGKTYIQWQEELLRQVAKVR